VKKPDGGRTPAVEVMLNSRHIAELIEKGDMTGIKEAMEQSMSPGSQTFEQALFKLYRDKVITLDEALNNADSANNLNWLINNTEAAPEKSAEEEKPKETEQAPAAGAFSEFTLKLGD
jgi:twitching motility protein PilU